MPENNFSKERILKNSAFLYLRMLFTMWFNLWATRLVLANLGVEDMGVYGVVGSIVGLFSVLTGGVTSAVQRFITFELGRKDGDTSKVFCTSLNVIFLLSLFILVVLEIAGVWFLNSGVRIPERSRDAAFWVFQLSVATSIIAMIAIPYNALIIAHEKMDAFAFISILQVLMNWGAAYCLSSIAKDERLVVYAILLTVVSVIIRVIYQVYCVVKFPEGRYHFILDRKLLREIGKYTGISTTSNILQTLSGQGVIFIINWTFGVGINAVYQIAGQLKNSVLSFSLNIFKAISPQITKTYADGEHERHEKLVYSGSKIELYMILLILIPFIFRAPYIMHLWLGNVPQYTTFFCMCTIFQSLLYACIEPIRTAVYATNRISRFMIIPEVFYLVAVLLVSFLVAKLTGDPRAMIFTVVAIDIITGGIRIYYAREVSFVRFRPLAVKVLLPVCKVAIPAAIVCYGLSVVTKETLLGLVLLLLINTTVMFFLVYFVGIDRQERNVINVIIKKIVPKAL